MEEASQSTLDEQRAKRLEEQQARYNSLVTERLQCTTDAAPSSLVRTKAARLIHSNLLDYKHNSPTNLKKSVELLKRCAENILQHPEEAKYRRVRSATAAFQNHIAAYPAAVELLSLMGWHTAVENLEKFWVFEHPVGSPQFKVLGECSIELQKGLAEVEHKENLLLDKSDKKLQEQQRREAVLRAIEEDYQDRQRAQALKQQTQAGSDAPTSS